MSNHRRGRRAAAKLGARARTATAAAATALATITTITRAIDVVVARREPVLVGRKCAVMARGLRAAAPRACRSRRSWARRTFSSASSGAMRRASPSNSVAQPSQSLSATAAAPATPSTPLTLLRCCGGETTWRTRRPWMPSTTPAAVHCRPNCTSGAARLRPCVARAKNCAWRRPSARARRCSGVVTAMCAVAAPVARVARMPADPRRHHNNTPVHARPLRRRSRPAHRLPLHHGLRLLRQRRRVRAPWHRTPTGHTRHHHLRPHHTTTSTVTVSTGRRGRDDAGRVRVVHHRRASTRSGHHPHHHHHITVAGSRATPPASLARRHRGRLVHAHTTYPVLQPDRRRVLVLRADTTY